MPRAALKVVDETAAFGCTRNPNLFLHGLWHGREYRVWFMDGEYRTSDRYEIAWLLDLAEADQTIIPKHLPAGYAAPADYAAAAPLVEADPPAIPGGRAAANPPRRPGVAAQQRARAR